jgi:hypothetical protein
MIIEQVPGGLSTLSGGTRGSIRLDRPWQADIVVTSSSCPFDAEPSVEPCAAPGWKVLQNPYTPFNFHRLIVPSECWPVGRVRMLGGLTQITAALTTAASLVPERENRWLGVNIGPSAGQNQPHLHYHLVDFASCHLESDELKDFGRLKDRTIFEADDVRGIVAGFRAAQVFFIPSAGQVGIEAFAAALEYVTSLYSVAFRSVQGLPPDYVFAAHLFGRSIRYATYIPILNQWGFTEYLGLIEKTPVVLPWPHLESVRHLRDTASTMRRDIA